MSVPPSCLVLTFFMPPKNKPDQSEFWWNQDWQKRKQKYMVRINFNWISSLMWLTKSFTNGSAGTRVEVGMDIENGTVSSLGIIQVAHDGYSLLAMWTVGCLLYVLLSFTAFLGHGGSFCGASRPSSETQLSFRIPSVVSFFCEVDKVQLLLNKYWF